MDLGRYLKVLRAKEGLTQKGLADNLGYTREYIADIERGVKFGSFAFWYELKNNFNILEAEFLEICKERIYLDYEKKKARQNNRTERAG